MPSPGPANIPIRRRQDLPPSVGEIPPPFCQEDALNCAAGAGQLAGGVRKEYAYLHYCCDLERDRDVHVYSRG